MKPAPFEGFGSFHLLALTIIAALAIALPLGARLFRRGRASGAVAIVLGSVLLALKVGETGYALTAGYDWRYLLPLHLCDAAAVAAGIMLLTRALFLYELAYFWGMAGTLQALITPALGLDFPHPDFWFFFATHGLVVIGAVFATAALGLRPAWKSIPRVFGATAVLALIAAPVNWLLGTNYLYLCAKPPVASLMDYLGPWPWYILTLVPVSLLFFALYYLPFWFADSLRSRKAGAATHLPG
jgi:hypothetical integral membrane protein (TIGR02206 family)